MGMRYFKRYRMEISLERRRIPKVSLPSGYQWVPWNDSVLDRHAHVKYESFRSEIDARLFPCLGNLHGCQRLMHEITEQRNFLRQATWMILWEGPTQADAAIDCGTIQGIAQDANIGAVQNVGVAPGHRGLGLGRALLLKSLAGFREAKIRRVSLEVTAENKLASQLYHSVGFRLTRTMYKAVASEPAHV